jgi:hypothetical protein
MRRSENAAFDTEIVINRIPKESPTRQKPAAIAVFSEETKQKRAEKRGGDYAYKRNDKKAHDNC